MASGGALRAGRLMFIWSSVYCTMENNLKGITCRCNNFILLVTTHFTE